MSKGFLMATTQQFDSNYSGYWKGLTNSPTDAESPPSPATVGRILANLLSDQNRRFHEGLDIACGYGRLSGVMEDYCTVFDGVEIEPTAGQEARALPYRQVFSSSFEQFAPTVHYDFALCWAAFEVLDQDRTLTLLNHALSQSGIAIISGKNTNYFRDDHGAAAAETGAATKGFLQWFTDAEDLEASLENYGFVLERALVFPRRGDAALERSTGVLTGVPDHPFYEFALCLRKVASPQPHNSSESWSFRVSNTLRVKQKHSI